MSYNLVAIARGQSKNAPQKEIIYDISQVNFSEKDNADS